jgi:hypothetical protein
MNMVNTELPVGWWNPDKQAAIHWQFPNTTMSTTEIPTLHNPISFGYHINGFQLHIWESLLYIFQNSAYALATNGTPEIARILDKALCSSVYVPRVDGFDETLSNRFIALD